METHMDLDDLKQAWQTLGKQIEERDAMHLDLHRDLKLEKARASLRPLLLVQFMQVLFGLSFILLASALWIRGATLSSTTIASGIALHVYGIAVLALAGATIATIARFDYAVPMLAIQQQLTRLRRLYVVNSMISGLSWWFLWMPLLDVIVALLGGDVFASAPAVFTCGTGVGTAGMLATLWLHRRARRAGHEGMQRHIGKAWSGSSILRMQRIIDDIRRFEQE